MVRVLESAFPDEGLLTMFAVRVQVKCYQKYFMIFTDTSDKRHELCPDLHADIIQEKVIRISIKNAFPYQPCIEYCNRVD